MSNRLFYQHTKYMNIKNKISEAYRVHLSYKQKLYLPILLMLWLLVGVFAVFQSSRENEFKRAAITSRVNLINRRVIALYERNQDLQPFLEFIEEYFDTSLLQGVSLAVYDAVTGEQLAEVGFDAPPPRSLTNVHGEPVENNTDIELDELLDPDRTFYYLETTSDDGSIIVQSILPYNEKIEERVSRGLWWWLIIIGAGVVMSIVIYLTTSHVARNVKLLREFADKAAADVDFDPNVGFGRDDLGNISRRIAEIYKDTKAAKAQREIEHKVAIQATEQRAAMKRELTNNISHELKTPVGVIRGYIDTLVENPDMDDNSRTHFLNKTRDHVERLCNLLNDLSTMTRLDDGSRNILMDDVDFNQLLDGIKHDVEESGIAGDMKFEIDIPDGIVVKANGALLTGAIMNLVKNAVNYSHGTEMGVKMLTRNARIITFVFYDNGTGVEEEHIPHLFERFYRVDKGRSRKAGGTGLGLPIVKSSFNSMDGSITVRNGSECGLEFVFALKLARPARTSREPRATSRHS